MRFLVLLVLVIAIATAAWMTRISTIEVHPNANGSVFAVVTDRWMGKVYACDLTACLQIYPSSK